MQKQFYFTIALVLTDSDDIQIVIFCNIWLDVDLMQHFMKKDGMDKRELYFVYLWK